jgi:signal transduction histidine kinase
MSVTLHGKQQAWGVLGVYAKIVREFSEEDTTFLQAIANLMALAIEAHQAETALRTRNRFQAATVRLGLEALASQELDDTLDLLVREAGATLRTDSCCVLELDAERTNFGLRAAFGWPVGSQGPAEITNRNDTQAHYTLQSLEPITSPDLRRETRFTVQPGVLQQGAISSLSVILQGKQQAWGVLSVHTKVNRLFTADDSAFLQAVANLMALAIERARAETVLHHRNLQQAAVALLGRRAFAGPHMDDLFADAAREVSATLDVEVCDILQRTPTGQTLVLRAGVGWQPGLVGAARIPAGNGSQAGYTLNSPGPVIVEDQRTETRFETASILQDHGIVSSMSVLVPGRAGPFGVLGAHTRTHRTFTQDDSNFLQSVANLLAGAIERHRVEGELRRHRDNLEGLVEERTALLAASNRELEAFSYTISHDLRAPLRSINGLSKLIQRKHGEALPPAAKEMLQRMADETVRMGRLIESILSLSRLGSVHVNLAPVDVSAMAETVLRSLETSDPERKVEWTVDPDVTALGDEALLRLMLENLLGNAWKFTSRTPQATIKLGRDMGGFHVEDNGAGFDMAHAKELFQPFHRLHAADDFEGTGIGLATVSRIVGRHGGRVWAQGALGQGATFRVTLPMAVAAGVEAGSRTYVPLHPAHIPVDPEPLLPQQA